LAKGAPGLLVGRVIGSPGKKGFGLVDKKLLQNKCFKIEK
jgi:hypothetical protein